MPTRNAANGEINVFILYNVQAIFVKKIIKKLKKSDLNRELASFFMARMACKLFSEAAEWMTVTIQPYFGRIVCDFSF
jgi:hypothetical protein